MLGNPGFDPTGVNRKTILDTNNHGVRELKFSHGPKCRGFVSEFPEDALLSCSGISVFQLPMTTLAKIFVGHVRVGMEDNINYRRGEKLSSNARVVKRTVRIANELNREIATSTLTRKILRLSESTSQYP